MTKVEGRLTPEIDASGRIRSLNASVSNLPSDPSTAAAVSYAVLANLSDMPGVAKLFGVTLDQMISAAMKMNATEDPSLITTQEKKR